MPPILLFIIVLELSAVLILLFNLDLFLSTLFDFFIVESPKFFASTFFLIAVFAIGFGLRISFIWVTNIKLYI